MPKRRLPPRILIDSKMLKSLHEPKYDYEYETHENKLSNHEFNQLNLKPSQNVAFVRKSKCLVKKYSPLEKNKALNEISTLKKIKKAGLKNFSKLNSYYFDPLGYVFVFIEYIEGNDLFKIIIESKYNRLNPKIACYFLYQLILLVSDLFRLGIYHGDIKPENIIVDKDNKLHLIDFDLSNHGYINNSSGTPAYMSPEIRTGIFDEYTIKSDIFSCGVVFFVMLFGFLPFENNDYQDPFIKFEYLSKSSSSKILYYDGKLINNKIIKLVRSMIDFSNYTRPSIIEIKRILEFGLF